MKPRLLARRTSRHRQSFTGASHVLTVMANASIRCSGRRRYSRPIISKWRWTISPNTRWMASSRLSGQHIEQVLNFVRGWDRRAPLVALLRRDQPLDRKRLFFAAACLVNPHRDEISIARRNTGRLPRSHLRTG